MDLKETEILGKNISEHWYYHSKLDYILYLLKDSKFETLLDIGSGSGFFSKGLLNKDKAKAAELMDIGYEEAHEENINGKELRYINKITKSNAKLVLMIDIIEHIDNDVDFLKNYLNVTNDAIFIICVPAFNFMWSKHDVFLGHKRRYTIRTLSKLIKDAGLRTDSINYYYSGVFPLAFIVRMINKYFGGDDNKSSLKKHNKIINALLYFISRLEIFIARYNKIFGLSVFAVATKNNTIK